MTYDPTEVNSVEDNASAYIDATNNLLAQNHVLDKEGNPAQLAKLAGSPMWLFALAYGQNLTEWQERLRVVNAQLDIANCTEEQVLNLAQIAGVIREEGSSPFVTLHIRNTTDVPVLYNPSTVVAKDSFSNNSWYCSQNFTLAGHEEADLLFYCAHKDVSVPAGTAFVLTFNAEAYPTYTIVSEDASIIVTKQETIAELRNKLMQGVEAFNGVAQAQEAIKGLNGIVKCSIWFNPDPNLPMTLPGNITVPARMTFVAIQGVDTANLLAEVYLRYLDVATYRILNQPDLPDSLASSTILGAGGFTAYYSVCSEVPVYVKVLVKPFAGDTTYEDLIKDTIMAHAYDSDVGAQITTQQICYWLNEVSYSVEKLITASVSMDGITWSNKSSVTVLEVGVFTRDKIIVEVES